MLTDRSFATLVLGVCIYLGLRLHHRRAMRRLREAHAETTGWQRLKVRSFMEVWQCGWCGAVCVTWEGMHTHNEDSPCRSYSMAVEARAASGRSASTEIPWTAITEEDSYEQEGAS